MEWSPEARAQQSPNMIVYNVTYETDYMFYMEPEIPVQGVDRRFWVTQDVFIVGYPFGLDTGFLRSKVNPPMSSTALGRYPRGY